MTRFPTVGTGEGEASVPTRRDTWTHGSRRGYDLGCRCFDCRIAHHRYKNAWRNGHHARTDAQPIAAHLHALIGSGWTRQDISREAGIAKTTPWKILSGQQQQVNSRTAASILDLEPMSGPVWLDVAPLVDAIEAAPGPLNQKLQDRSDCQAYTRARARGRVSDAIADRLAIRALGRTLEEIYGTNWDQEAA